MEGGLPVFLKETEEEFVVGHVIGFHQVHKSNVGPKVVIVLRVEEGFQGEKSILAAYFRCPTKLKLCAMEFKETESAVVHNWTEDFTADIYEHDASLFVGVRNIALFWNGDALAFVPSIVVSGAIKELANIMVDPQSHSPLEGLVRFWWDAIEP